VRLHAMGVGGGRGRTSAAACNALVKDCNFCL